MSDPTIDWERMQERHNEEYLAAALHWLRLQLRALPPRPAGEEPATVTVLTHAPEPVSWWRRALWPQPPEVPASRVVVGSPQAARESTEREIEAARMAMLTAQSADPPPYLVVLGQILGLTSFEREILLLCAAMELDPGMGTLIAVAQPDGKSMPTFALALNLFADRSWDALLPGGRLRRWGLIEINQASGQPLTSSPLRADERMVNFLKGVNVLDDRLEPLTSLAPSAEGSDLPRSQNTIVRAIVDHWVNDHSDRSVINLLGPDRTSKEAVASHTAARMGRRLYRIPAEFFPSQPAELETWARLWQRECLLLPIALYVDAEEIDVAAGQGTVLAINRFLDRGCGMVFLGSRERWPELDGAHAIEVDRPTAAEQRAGWAAALGEHAATIPDLLAGQFHFDLTTIVEIALEEGPVQPDDVATAEQRLWAACRTRTSPRMDALAQRIEPRATWDDLILPAEERSLLERIVAQVGQRSTVYEDFGFGARMSRGRGISALFSGQSGTGKTMAAEVMANSLKLSLYRIDLSAVVSKYIGETEKNLRRLFDAAEEGGAILFFDEADAIFGKRSEVKDAHDRYANIEVNYLLQRMESYRGLAILATNMRSALDTAFMRRLRFIVEFPFPGIAERRLIWQQVFPAEMDIEPLDEQWNRLARLPATGGMIHNIALNAAFAAADAGAPLTLAMIGEAARAEFRKLELPMPERELKRLDPEPLTELRAIPA
jgi:hypothetical protein